MRDANGAPEVWLFSAYRADSHAAWADWLVESQSWLNWHRFELPGRYFAWRIRGNPLSWLDALPDSQPDAIVATSMVDLATLKGLHPRLGRVPSLLYFHENQFAYPRSSRQFESIEPQMVQLYGALAAQRVLFNSAYNRDSFLDGVTALLHKMPDHLPCAVADRLAQRSGLCAVPVRPISGSTERQRDIILWNHRWEYDKAPQLFVGALQLLARRGVGFRLALLGSRPNRVPKELRQLRVDFADRILVDEKVDLQTYRQVLGRCAIAVSTAQHEFQGLAMLEAASAGARPLVPDALCYPEQYPPRYRYTATSAMALADRLQDWLCGGLPAPVDVSAWYSEALDAAWKRELQALLTVARQVERKPRDCYGRNAPS